MNFGDLRSAIAAYMHRDPSSFVEYDRDSLVLAVNNAIIYCQRAIKLEFARVNAQVTVDLTNGADISTAVLYGTATPVVVRSVERAFLKLVGVSDYVPVDIRSRDAFTRRVQRRYEGVTSLNRNDFVKLPTTFPITLVQYGTTLYVFPQDAAALGISGQTTIIVYLDIVKWLDRVNKETDTNFLFTYCFDFLQFRAIHELNFFLKEDQRVPVSEKLLSDVWNNVVQWNATIVGSSVDDATLD